MQHALAERVRSSVDRYGMIRPGHRVGVAVSGGGDSVALLRLLLDLRQFLGARILVVHFNHLLRGHAAQADEDFSAALAAENGLEFLLRREDVAAAARQSGANLEAAGRERRYAFFRELAAQGIVDRIATGHTEEDQAETVLARAVRGTGLRGLTAIHPVSGPVIRPLLQVRRAELREYLTARGQPWREDATNRDTSRLRARLRLHVLPMLEAECGAAVTRNLARLADLARGDEAFLEAIVEERFQSMAARESDGIWFPVADLRHPWPTLPGEEPQQALALRLVRRTLQELKGNLKRFSAEHVQRILGLVFHGASGDRVELPGGWLAERRLDRLMFRRRQPPASRLRTSAPNPAYFYSWSAQDASEVILPIAETGKRLWLKLIDWPAPGSDTYPDAGALDADRLDFPLVVRNWMPGDAFRPLGRRQTEKLKRLLLERRICGSDRARWPVVVSGGRPVWTEGLPVAADYAPGPATKRALVMQVTAGDKGRK